MALRAVSADFDEVMGFGDAVWRADALARHTSPAGVVASGHELLDAELPGGGWPVGALCEILQTHSVQSEWRLLLPALCAAQRSAAKLGRASWVALIGPPYAPFGPALAAHGLGVQQLLWVKAQAPAERLWAAEQALRCAGVAAVLAWLPQAQAASLRRLQMAALTHAKLLFVMRPVAAQHESSPAVLRLLLLAQGTGINAKLDPGALNVQVLKRRGPPLADTLSLPAREVVLSELFGLCASAEPVVPRAGIERKAIHLAQRHALAGLAA
jgi:protein ImuA